MALPLSRDETAVAGAQIKSSLLNNVQDSIVGAKHGDVTIEMAAAQFTPEQPSHANNLLIISPHYWTNTVTAHNFLASLRLNDGDRIKSIDGFIKDSATPATMKLWKAQLSNGVVTQIGATQTSSGGSADQMLTIPSLTEVVVTGFAYFLQIGLGAANHRLYGARMLKDHP